MFTARYGLIPYTKQITLRLEKVTRRKYLAPLQTHNSGRSRGFGTVASLMLYTEINPDRSDFVRASEMTALAVLEQA